MVRNNRNETECRHGKVYIEIIKGRSEIRKREHLGVVRDHEKMSVTAEHYWDYVQRRRRTVEYMHIVGKARNVFSKYLLEPIFIILKKCMKRSY